MKSELSPSGTLKVAPTEVSVTSSVITVVLLAAVGPREGARDERRDARPLFGASADDGSKAPFASAPTAAREGCTDGARDVRREGGRDPLRGEVEGPRDGARLALRGDVSGPREGARDVRRPPAVGIVGIGGRSAI